MTPADAQILPAYLAMRAGRERGAVLMAKIISDQISGSARAGWIGGAFALLGAGAPILAGTLAGGHLRRRGCRRRVAAFTYLELTLVSAVTAELVGLVVLNPTGAELAGGLGAPFAALALIGLTAVAVLSASAAVKRRPVPLRVGLILVWATIIPLAVFGTFWWPGATVAAAVLAVAALRTNPPRAESSGPVELSAGV